MTIEGSVLRFPATATGSGSDAYGRFSRELSADELASCFFFTDEDRGRIAARRGDHNRLGFAVQLGTVRYLGRFLEDPARVPAGVVAWTIREMGVDASTTLQAYAGSEGRWEHQAHIRRDYDYTRLAPMACNKNWCHGFVRARGLAPRATVHCSRAPPSI